VSKGGPGGMGFQRGKKKKVRGFNEHECQKIRWSHKMGETGGFAASSRRIDRRNNNKRERKKVSK